jgi:predicted nucleic acid-binding protein
VIAYVDTSALLRIVLQEPGRVEDLQTYDQLISSELVAVESPRTIDRLRQVGSITTEEAVRRREVVSRWLEAIDLVLLRPAVLSRAADPLPVPLGTLDAIHLATAVIWRERHDVSPVVITHDASLALAARAFGFEVRGT